MHPDIQPALDKFLTDLQAKMDGYMQRRFPTLPRKLISVEQGPKYARVIESQEGCTDGRSVYCFIELATGNVLKADSWKSPCKKNPRGNILTGDPLNDGNCGPYGTRYITGGGNYEWGDR